MTAPIKIPPVKKRSRFGKRVPNDERISVKTMPEEYVLKSCQRGLTKQIESEKDIYKRERLRVIREEIKLILRTVY